MKNAKGAVVLSVEPESIAEELVIEKGDKIISINEMKLSIILIIIFICYC